MSKTNYVLWMARYLCMCTSLIAHGSCECPTPPSDINILDIYKLSWWYKNCYYLQKIIKLINPPIVYVKSFFCTQMRQITRNLCLYGFKNASERFENPIYNTLFIIRRILLNWVVMIFGSARDTSALNISDSCCSSGFSSSSLSLGSSMREMHSSCFSFLSLFISFFVLES